MRTTPFTETLECDLTEEERNDRGREATRKALALERFKAETKRLEEAWKATKKERVDGEDERVKELWRVSGAADTGKEVREVPCEEVLVGVMVETRRKGGRRDTEFVSARAATKDELRGAEKPKKLGPPAAEEKTAKIRAGVQRLAEKGRTEAAILKALESGVPEATAAEHKAALDALVAAGELREEAGKLFWAAPPPAESGDGHDDHKPGATHH